MHDLRRTRQPQSFRDTEVRLVDACGKQRHEHHHEQPAFTPQNIDRCTQVQRTTAGRPRRAIARACECASFPLSIGHLYRYILSTPFRLWWCRRALVDMDQNFARECAGEQPLRGDDAESSARDTPNVRISRRLFGADLPAGRGAAAFAAKCEDHPPPHERLVRQSRRRTLPDVSATTREVTFSRSQNSNYSRRNRESHRDFMARKTGFARVVGVAITPGFHCEAVARGLFLERVRRPRADLWSATQSPC